MAKYQILRWKEIPAQVKAFDGSRSISRQMPEQYQLEIDRIAMEEGLAGSDDYLKHWHWTTKLERPGSAEEVLESVFQELNAEWGSRIRPEQS
jgi:hypothetical protein